MLRLIFGDREVQKSLAYLVVTAGVATYKAVKAAKKAAEALT